MTETEAEAVTEKRSRRVSGTTWLAIGTIAFGAVILLVALFPGVGRGYELTDEAGYLVGADPNPAGASNIGFFGYFVHPLYAVTGYSVPLYRFVSLVIMAVAGGYCGWSLGRLLVIPREAPEPDAEKPEPNPLVLLMTVAGLVLPMGFYCFYLITPGYNFVCVVGILLAVAGICRCLVSPGRGKRILMPTALFAFGLLLTGAGRPISGAMTALAGAVVIVLVGRQPLKTRLFLVLISAVLTVAMAAISALVIGLDNVALAIKVLTYFPTAYHGEQEGGLFGLTLNQLVGIPGLVLHWAGVTFWFAFAPLGAFLADPGARRKTAEWVAVVVAFFTIVYALAQDGFVGGYPGAGVSQGAWLGLLAVVAVACLCVWVVRRYSPPPGTLVDEDGEIIEPEVVDDADAEDELEDTETPPEPMFGTRRIVVIALLLVVCALTLGFGSTNGPVTMLLHSNGLVALAIVLIIASCLSLQQLVITALTVAGTGALVLFSLFSAQASPYRASPIAYDTESTVITWRDSAVKLAAGSNEQLQTFENVAVANGWQHGTPLADFTPFNPGLGYRLGSQGPTTLSFYNSNESAIWVMEQQDKQLWCSAWLLSAPKDTPLTFSGKIDPEPVMKIVGMNYPADYTALKGALPEDSFTLWKPKQAAVDRCQAAAH